MVDQGQSSGKNMASGVPWTWLASQHYRLLAGDLAVGPRVQRGALAFSDLSAPPLEKALGFCHQEWELAYFAQMYCFPKEINPGY